MTTVARCPVCDKEMPARDRIHSGRKARYCSGACKAKAYRARQQACGSPAPDEPPLPPAARHARAVEIRQQASDLSGILADTASGQEALFASPDSTRRARPADTARTLHRLITELAALATAATVTKRVTLRRPPAGTPQTTPLFDDPQLLRAAHERRASLTVSPRLLAYLSSGRLCRPLRWTPSSPRSPPAEGHRAAACPTSLPRGCSRDASREAR